MCGTAVSAVGFGLGVEMKSARGFRSRTTIRNPNQKRPEGFTTETRRTQRSEEMPSLVSFPLRDLRGSVVKSFLGFWTFDVGDRFGIESR